MRGFCFGVDGVALRVVKVDLLGLLLLLLLAVRVVVVAVGVAAVVCGRASGGGEAGLTRWRRGGEVGAADGAEVEKELGCAGVLGFLLAAARLWVHSFGRVWVVQSDMPP